MYFELKENKPHGTKDDPFSTYHIKNEGRSFQIPVHWHDGLEIIYVKSGFLTVSISGENYIGTPGDAACPSYITNTNTESKPDTPNSKHSQSGISR